MHLLSSGGRLARVRPRGHRRTLGLPRIQVLPGVCVASGTGADEREDRLFQFSIPQLGRSPET